MTGNPDRSGASAYWGTIDRLQGELGPLQALEAYGTLLHEIPLPIWVEDWSRVRLRLEGLEPPPPDKVEGWLNGRPELLRELYDLMPVVDTNAAAVAFFGHVRREDVIERVMGEPPVGSLEACSRMIGAFMSGEYGLDWVMPAPPDMLGRPRWMRATCYLPPRARACWSHIVYATQDVTEQRHAEEALAGAKAEADAANRAKSEFLANVSHELRTPLNAIAGFSELLLEEKLGRLGHEAYLEYARYIRDGGEHLLDLINDLLDLSRVETGVASLKVDAFDVRDVVEGALRLVQDKARRSGLDMLLDLPDTPVTIVADERKLRQILVNLLSNAVNYTDPGGRVVVACKLRAGNSIELTVRDTGIGMTAEQLPVAMERFGRVKRDGVSAPDGVGLGLPLTQALVVLHGGTFLLESEPGTGTVATVVLPTGPDQASTAHP